MLYKIFYRYVGFDFHRECKSLNWDRLTLLKDLLATDILKFRYNFRKKKCFDTCHTTENMYSERNKTLHVTKHGPVAKRTQQKCDAT